jgi:hypothetical protein
MKSNSCLQTDESHFLDLKAVDNSACERNEIRQRFRKTLPVAKRKDSKRQKKDEESS